MRKPNPKNETERKILERITKYCQATYYPDLVERMIEIQWAKWKMYGIYHVVVDKETNDAENQNTQN